MDWLFLPVLNRPGIKWKSRSFIFSTLMICGSGLIIFILFQFSTTQTSSPGFTKLTYSKEMSASGLSFNTYNDNQKTISFKADTIEIARKKVGFFRIGFYKTAKINGLQIGIFFYPEQKKLFEGSADLAQYLLNNESFETLSLDNIKELVIKDIEINFYQNDHMVSSIKSDHADIKFYKKDLTFSGNVLIACGNEKALRSHSLSWVVAENQFSTTDTYRLIMGEYIFEGKGISCDYMLNKVNFLSEPKKYSTTF